MTTKSSIIISTIWNQKILKKSSLSNAFNARNSKIEKNDVLQKTSFADFAIKRIIESQSTSLKNAKSKKKKKKKKN